MADRIVVMNHGVVEQIGTPADVYNEPRTLFVARFVGRMNVLTARAEDGGLARVGTLALRMRPGTRVSAGAPIVLAIRPEELLIGEAAQASESAVVARVAAVQFLGAFTRLSLVLPGDAAVLECDIAAGALASAAVKEGAELPVALPTAALRAFPAE